MNEPLDIECEIYVEYCEEFIATLSSRVTCQWCGYVSDWVDPENGSPRVLCDKCGRQIGRLVFVPLPGVTTCCGEVES